MLQCNLTAGVGVTPDIRARWSTGLCAAASCRHRVRAGASSGYLAGGRHDRRGQAARGQSLWHSWPGTRAAMDSAASPTLMPRRWRSFGGTCSAENPPAPAARRHLGVGNLQRQRALSRPSSGREHLFEIAGGGARSNSFFSNEIAGGGAAVQFIFRNEIAGCGAAVQFSPRRRCGPATAPGRCSKGALPVPKSHLPVFALLFSF